MKKVLIAAILLMVPGMAFALDAPHDVTGTISCGHCHWTAGSSAPWSGNTPLGFPDNTLNNTRCVGCHRSGGAADMADAHSSRTLGTKYWAVWNAECVDCHNPHYQRQERAYPALYPAGAHLVVGGIQLPIPAPGGDGNTIINLQTQLSADYRNYSIMPDARYPFYYRILEGIDGSAPPSTLNSTQIKVKGDVKEQYIIGNPAPQFAIVYGKYIYDNISYTTPGGIVVNTPVKFLSPGGDFGPGDPANKTTDVCYVCHKRAIPPPSVEQHATSTPCASCHSHPLGFPPIGGDCNGCHGESGPTGAPLIATDLVTQPNATGHGVGAHNKHVTTQGYTNCNICHNGNGMPTLDKVITISLSNYATANNSSPSYIGSTLNAPFTYNPGVPDTGSQDCSSVYCHSNVQGNNGNGAPTTYAAVSWGGTTVGDTPTATVCGDCHQSDSGPSKMSTGSHTRHVNAGTYNMPCANCHTNAGSANPLVHVNNVINVNMAATYGGSYSGGTGGSHAPGQGYGDCSTVYCHSDGLATPSVYKTQAWGSSLPGDCTGCHNNDANTVPLKVMSSGNHTQHVNNAAVIGTNRGCVDCHNTTVSGNRTIINPAGFALHANKSRDVGIATGGDWSGTQCSNAYCHSTGKAGVVNTGNLPGAYSGTHYSTMTWGDTTNIGCNGCHGKSTSDGHPDYTSVGVGQGTSNSHEKHVVNSTITCNECHINTTQNNTSIVSSSTAHLNQAITTDVVFDPAGNNSAGIYQGNRSCANTYCHGIAASSPQWGSTTQCNTCHAANDALPASHLTHYQLTTPLATSNITGIGSDTTHYIFQCGECHNPANTHHAGGPVAGSAVGRSAEISFAGTNPSGTYFEGTIPTTDGAGYVWTDASCSNLWCHGNFAGSGNNATAVWNGTAACGTCHDASTTFPIPGAMGGGSHNTHVKVLVKNCEYCHYSSVNKATAGDTPGSLAIRDKSVHANGQVTWSLGIAEYTGFFRNDALQSQYAGAISGNRPAGQSGSYSACTNIYCHSSVQKPGGNALTLASEYATTPAWGTGSVSCGTCHKAVTPGNEINTGSHTTHYLTKGWGCAQCHNNAGDDNAQVHADYVINVNIDGNWSVGAFAISYNGSASNPGNHAPGMGYGNCSNLYCHSIVQESNGGALDGSAGDFKTPLWGDTAPCGSCHKGQTLGGSLMDSGSHSRHVDTNTYVHASTACSDCHNNGGKTNEANHVNKIINVNIAATFGGAYADPTGGPGNGYTTCSTTYCHSNVQSANGTAAFDSSDSPTWGATGTVSCAALSCHADATNGMPLTGSHNAHVTTHSYACQVCHKDAGESTTAHVDKLITMNLDTTYNFNGTANYSQGTHAPGSGGYGNCSNVQCHGIGQPIWNDATTAECGDCHAANNSLAKSHPAHYQDTGNGNLTTSGIGSVPGSDTSADPGKYIFRCLVCHNGGTSTHINQSSPVDFAFDSAVANWNGALQATYQAGGVSTADPNGFNWTNAQCSNTYCHGNFPSLTNGNNATPEWGTTNGAPCGSCHDTDASASMTGGKHNRHVKDMGYKCNMCHTLTTDNTNAIIDRSIHVSGAVDWDFGTYNQINTFGDTSVYRNSASGTRDKSVMGPPYGNCTNIYCHSNVQTSPPGGAATYVSLSWSSGTAACGSCHKAGPAGGGAEQDTGSHLTHVSASKYTIGCSECHLNAGSGTSKHVDYAVDVNTTNWQGSGVTASYSGTPVPGNAYGSCANIYCHSIGDENVTSGQLPGGAASRYATQVWTATSGTVGCNGCHGRTTPNGSPDYTSGAAGAATANTHPQHSGATLGFTCEKCHYDTTTTGNSITGYTFHVVNISNTDVKFNPWALNSSSGYNAANGFKNCSNVYCHSTVQANGGTAGPAPAGYNTVQWGGASLNCTTACHTSAPATGSHAKHLANTSILCSACHNGSGQGSSPNKHADYNIDTAFLYKTISNGSYSQASNVPGVGGYGTCSSTNCHGTGSPTWGPSTNTDPCTKCHGTPSAAPATAAQMAPPSDLAGGSLNTDPQVGAHQAHLTSAHNYSSDISCTECHRVPVAFDSDYHIYDGTNDTTNGVAEVVFNGPLANTNVRSVPGVPNYAASTCSNVYCHDYLRFKSGWGDDASAPFADRTPTWNSPFLVGNANDCSQCHGYPPAAPHQNPAPDCHSCHTHVNGTENGFVSGQEYLHVNGDVESSGADSCSSCHSTANLLGRHSLHTNADTILAGKTLSNGDYGKLTWWYTYSNTGGVPLMACGFCHPQSEATHRNSINNLNFDPNDTGASGSLKALNNPTPDYTQNPGVSVLCRSVYCHSNGYKSGSLYGYVQSPDWFGGTFAGDKCNDCHLNSPTGSVAHAGHAIGIHSLTIYTGTTGLATTGNTATGSHGNATTATTINCNVCHVGTVTTAANALSSVCSSCHTDANNATIGNDNMIIAAASTTHVNGIPEVSFNAVQVRSKAQIRDNITTVAELNSNWTRTGGYKASGAYDITPVSGTLNTATMWNSGSKTCSNISCHNGYQVVWTSTNVTCYSCHKALP